LSPEPSWLKYAPNRSAAAASPQTLVEGRGKDEIGRGGKEEEGGGGEEREVVSS